MVKYEPTIHTPKHLKEVVKLYGKTHVCSTLEISRPTLDKWIAGNWQIPRKKKVKNVNYAQVINHVKRKIKVQGNDVDPKLLKIMKECEGTKQRQKRLAMDLIDQINEILRI